MNELSLFLPCAAGVEDFLAQEVHALTGRAGQDLLSLRGGVRVRADWRDALRLNLHSRLAQRVLIELSHAPYGSEHDLYAIASGVAWEIWFTARNTFKIETTAQQSPLKSLNFATLRIKDAIVDRFRERAGGVRPSIETRWPDARVFAHLDATHCTLYIDTSGESLFKRGWRQDKGDAPLKETLAAAMLAASGWWNPETGEIANAPLYDPCCGSGTIAIEAAQLALGIAAGSVRRFGFEKLLPFQAHVWAALKAEAQAAVRTSTAAPIFGSDVSHRMVDFAQRNAERAGVAAAVQFRGGDALQRMPPAESGVIVLNPPYGERIEVGGVTRGRREQAQTEDGGEFFQQLASHWKKSFAGWTAWVLTPDLQLPKRMRLKESRRVPMWNGPIECRLFRFDMVAGSARGKPAA
ncbi:class I SAM-dependent RNA methyltransferase [Variovorax sp. KK3]|uniref:THUMP domain-containing class I SAM-dependent RNA methyltransferase n=1 Tax=Variovorax sp. KK3 TaxID=1855728 RepID=UPI00097BD593|nr:THUMP domain-containing protein [Variovorax sp. KK3]